MALGKNLSTGRFNAAQTPIMKRVRKPRFVDNAVRHGEYTKVQAGFKVAAPTQSDFLPTHDRKYLLAEEGDTIRILHNPSDGHRYTGAVYADLDKVTTSSTLPPLFVGSENIDQALVPSSIESSTKGTRYRIENLKGRDLSQIGFTNKTVHIAQKVGVGLRTSDLAIRVSKGTNSSLNGVVAPNPSATFVAQDFYGTDAITALRFLSRHDNYNIRGDSFGNLYYVHQKKHGREHTVSSTMVSEGSVSEVSESIPNRVIVRGKSRANNDDNSVQVDDRGPQSIGVNEIPGGIYAPTAITKSSARTVGRKFLSMAKQATGGETLRGVFHASNIQPGDIVSYRTRTGSQRKIVLSTQHDLTKRKSELRINSAEASLEDIIQRFQEADISSSLNNNSERNRQFSTEEFSTSFGFKMKVSWQLDVREVKNRKQGMAVGKVRGTIHGRRELKSTGTLINNGAGYAIGTTSFTTDGTAASTSFAVGDWVYRGNGNKLGKVASRTTTNVTIAIGSPDLVADNEELFLFPNNAMKEALNSHLKIGLNKGTYDSRRQG
tara:strand:+ start:15529 stop:17172 length:1644 start_codon:yes stop_codon:yes gene_type:complete